MKFNRTLVRGAWSMAAATAMMLGAAGAAQARDVYWSVGVNSPGVSVGVANAPPVYMQPAPVYVQPRPVYVQPAPVYVQPRPVYMQPSPVYYGAPSRYVQAVPVYQQGWVPPGHRHGHKHHRHDHRGDHRGDWDGDRDGRDGRWDRR